MKNLLYLAIIAAIFISSATADIDRYQLEEQINGPRDHKLPETDYTRGDKESTPLITHDKSWADKQGNQRYRMLVQRIGNSIYNWNFMGPRGRQYIGTPMVFDPTIGDQGLLGIIENSPYYAPDNTGNPPDNYRISIIVSTDMGDTWTRDSVYAVSSSDINGNLYTKLLQYPSFGMTNTDGTRTEEDFDFLTTAMNIDPTTRNLIEMNALFGLGIPGSDRFISENNYERVVNNASPDPQRYSRPQMVSSSASGKSGIHGISRLSPIDGVQYGYYGYISFATTIGLDVSSMPEVLWYDKFYHGDSPAINSSAMTEPEIGTDPSGNVYVAALANNVADADDYDNFVPTVWKSEYGDNGPGQEWSAPNAMPSSLILEWALTKFIADGVTQCDNFLELDRFNKQAFVVTGEDEYSFFTAIMPYKTSPTGTIEDASEAFIVESRYENGAWSLNEVAQVNENAAFTNSSFPVYLRWTDLEREAKGIEVGEEPALLQFTSGRGFELEAAKTADGNNIVVKYLDFRGPDETGIYGNTSCTYNLAEWKENIGNYDSIPTEWKYFFVGQNEFGITDTLESTQDYVRVNDIFVSHRSLSNDEWSETNVTNDFVNYQSTYMSRVVKDLNNVSIALSSVDPYYMEGTIYDDIPIQVGEIVSNEFNRGFSYALYDATTETNSNDELVDLYKDSEWIPTNVKNNNEELSFSIEKVYPNPVENDYFELLFNTEKAGNAQIKIYNSLGNEIATIFDGQLPRGMSGKSFNLSNYQNLITGHYYITLYMDGKSTTEILNVIK